MIYDFICNFVVNNNRIVIYFLQIFEFPAKLLNKRTATFVSRLYIEVKQERIAYKTFKVKIRSISAFI